MTTPSSTAPGAGPVPRPPGSAVATPAARVDGRADRLFSPRALVTLIVTIAVSFGLFLVLLVVGGTLPVSDGSDADSVSALGYRPFVEFLERLKIPVTVARWHSEQRAGPGSLVVLAEPNLGIVDPPPQTPGSRDVRDDSGFSPRTLADRRSPTLLVLPKRTGSSDSSHDGWLESTELVDVGEAQQILRATRLRLEVVRIENASKEFRSELLDPKPWVAGPVQLMLRSPAIAELVSSSDGVLVGRIDVGGKPLVVISDPDVIEAHGLHREGNAVIVATAVAAVLPEGGNVIVDAASQGRGRRPSFGRELFSWPLVLPVGTALFAALAAVLAGARRFGSPRPSPSPQGAHARPLVDRAAELQRRAGLSSHALGRYFDVGVAEARRLSNVPPGLDDEEARAWVDRAVAARGGGETTAEVAAVVAAATEDGSDGAVLGAAAVVHSWRRAFADGARTDS